MTGIYKIENTVNNKVYIGQSKDIEARWYQHIHSLEHGWHDNRHLQNSWNKYGQSSFSFSVIELCEEDKLTEREQYWIDFYGGINSDKTYNAKDADCTGKLSDESKRKISQSLLGNIPWNKGLTVDTDERVRQYVEHSKETFGGHHSEETKRKISDIIKQYHESGRYDYKDITAKRLQTIRDNSIVRKDKGKKRGKRDPEIGKKISEAKLAANEKKKKLGLPLRNQEKKPIPMKISICTVCGKEFQQRRCHNKKTCSSECKYIQMINSRRKNKSEQ